MNHPTNWRGYGRPDCKLTLRINPDPVTMAEVRQHNYHAKVAEMHLRERGIQPALGLYLLAIGRLVK